MDMTVTKASESELPGVSELTAEFGQRIPYPAGNEEEESIYGRLTNGQRIIGHLPRAIQEGIRAQSGALMRDGKLAPPLRQLIIVRVGYHALSIYEVEQHRSVAAKLGVTASKLDAMALRTPDGLGEAETAAIRLVDELVAVSRPSDATLGQARVHFSDGELLEIIFVVGNWWTLARLLETAGIPLDDERIGDRALTQVRQ